MSVSTTVYLVLGSVIIVVMQILMGGPQAAFPHLLEHLRDDIIEWRVHVLIFGMILVIYGAVRRLIRLGSS